MSARRSALAIASSTAVALLTIGLLGGCAGTVSLTRADDGVNPSCADVIVHLPETAGDAERRETNAQGTAAWGTPAGVLLHCGVEVPGPTTLECVEVNGVDWIQDDSRADEKIFTFTTYGRDPAVELTIDQSDTDAVSGSSVLLDVAAAVARIPQTNKCTAIGDSQTFPADG